MTPKQTKLEDIAKDHLQISTLDERSDRALDTYNLHVSNIKLALSEAYDDGYREATENLSIPEFVQEYLSPHAAAMLVYRLQVYDAQDSVRRGAESELQWFTDQVYKTIGEKAYKALCDEINLDTE